MSSQRRQSSVRATSPDQPKAPAKAKGKSKKQQRDHQNSDTEDQSPECAEDKGAPKRGSRKRQSKKEKDPRDCESEDKPHETPAPKRGSIIRQSKKQRDPSNLDREQSPESSKSKSEEKSVAKPRRLHGSAAETDFIGARNTQDAPPALSARNKKSAEKTATRGLSVDDTLGKILKDTIEKLKIKKFERSNASSCVNDITDKVIAHLKQNTTWCVYIESLRTGSYYENVKVSVAV